MRALRDISPPVDPDSPAFPGDRPLSSEWTFRIGPGCPVNVAALTLSPHVGAHADAPLHFVADGTPAGELPLDAYLGPCRVVHAMGAGPRVEWRHLAHAFPDADASANASADIDTRPRRVLVRTYERQPGTWDDDMTAVAAETVERLGTLGMRLIGTDAASLDPASSKTLDAHHAAHRHGMAILENLRLDEVPEGDYELIALPIKLATADAAPVRAVLRELA